MAPLLLHGLLAGALFSAGDDGDAKPAWDVDQPPGPTSTQTIETTTGTWMNLDVHPDGTWLVFDLLGDLYGLKMEGGDAWKITSGVAWDMQPRFSPDGSSIAFTSDRTGKGDKGGDNLWVIDADGKNPRQITSETFRLVTGPCWSPDGQSLVGRKHFTSRRSLGAGEMWMYHVSGVAGGKAGGLQLTDRPTDQKDVNEPVFDPTGRYLYYSMDATSGQSFEYDKDSNKQIYVIERLDLERQETDRLISGPGGACRPTPSPDGKTIAFVRRLGNNKTGLHLYDLASGMVRVVHDQLERDMQEAWAIHGVYTAMEWTPDNQSIVYWAGGGLHRVDVESGTISDIPFRVKDTRTVTNALRTPVEVGPETFSPKMLRWVTTSPDGKHVVFQSLGHLWIRTIDGGEPRRLTTQSEHFEFDPSFSRDGRFITYITWDDESLGSVRVVSVDGQEAWRLTRRPGHYVEPTFTPDGEQVLFRRVGGGWVTSPAYSHETGIYRIPARGGDMERVTKSGRTPCFGDDSSRVFLTRNNGGKESDGVEFYSVDLQGRDERVHFTSDWATEFAPSPDGSHIAFIERFRVWLAPFVDTGRSVKVSPKTSSFPVVQVSKAAGDFIHFGGNGTTLHWSLGATLHSRSLEDAMTCLAGGDAPEAVVETTDLSFTVPHAAPNQTLALTGGRIVTMNGDTIIEGGTVVIQGNRIVAVGKDGEVTIPKSATRQDVTGHVVAPGFVDVHAHGAQGANGLMPQQNWVDYGRLAFGVTTVHDPSNDTHEIFAASEATMAGTIVGPRTFSTGTILYGATGSFKAEIESYDDAYFHLERMKAVGAFSVKSYNQPRRDQRQQVIAAARDLDMMVVPEGGSTFMHNLTQIVDGHTGLEHTLPVVTIYDDVRDLWRGTGVGYTPTLVVAYGGLGAENYWYQVDEVWKNERLSTFVPPQVLIPRARRRTMAPEEDYNHIRVAGIANMVVEDGGTAHAGGHGQMQGIDTHWEMWGFVQGGMTAMNAMRCGTLFGAQYLGLDGDLGSIEVGKLADLVVFDEGADPTQNIRDTEKITFVVANGALFNARTMDRIAPNPVKRAQFFWEREGFGVGVLSLPERGCQGCGRTGVPSWAR